MKKLRFTYILLLSLLFPLESFSCGYSYPTHNYYMIKYQNRSSSDNLFSEDIDQYWHDYTKGHFDGYPYYDQVRLRDYLTSMGDNEMLSYLDDLNLYLGICDEINYSWDYPSEEDLADRASTLSSIREHCESYRGKLLPQYGLLYMRCCMLENKWDKVRTYWESHKDDFSPSVFRRMMLNIYAGSLYHLGDMDGATDIYSVQGDEQSIRWTLRKYRNLAGIKSLYKRSSNALGLLYLLQEFVNNAQETQDQLDLGVDTYYGGYLEIPRKEVNQFCEFCDTVIMEGKTENPCAWLTAKGMLLYILRDYSGAKSVMAKAMSSRGSERIKDNCRCVNILVWTSDTTFNSRWLLEELKWLESRSKTEGPNDYCFSYAFSRILMKGLVPTYYRVGDVSRALAIAGLSNELEVQQDHFNHRSPLYDKSLGSPTWNFNYSNEFTDNYLYPLSPESLIDYYAYLTSPHDDPLDQYICQNSYKGSDFFNDLIGTKLIAQSRFSDAIVYLKKVSLSYLSELNISNYMLVRDFHKENWLYRQGKKSDSEGISPVSFTSNPKIDYCEEVLSLQKSYSRNVNNSKGESIAYKLACLYYQASSKGDCWWLTSYGKSVNDSTQRYAWENDFVLSAERYLRVSQDSKVDSLRIKSIYALAYLPLGPGGELVSEYDPYSECEVISYVNVTPDSHKFSYLSNLSSYYREHRNSVPSYIRRCDVLRQFMKQQWLYEY